MARPMGGQVNAGERSTFRLASSADRVVHRAADRGWERDRGSVLLLDPQRIGIDRPRYDKK